MPRRLPALAASALLLGTAACGGGPSGSADSEDAIGSLSGVTAKGEVGSSLEVTLDEPLETEKARAVMLSQGDGATLRANDQVLLHLWVGNGTSGEEAANTYESGTPVAIQASEGQLFDVILDAILGRESGSRVAVEAPASEVWGDQGAPQLDIKAADTAVFVADIVSVEPAEVLDGPEGTEVEPPADAPGVVEEDGAVTGFDWSSAPKQPPTELEVIPLVEGDGPEVRSGSLVTFDYFGAVWGADAPFDESYSREPTPFGVGLGQLIPAWDESIPGLREGSRVMIVAPPETAYGDAGQNGIPGGSTLVFVVDVLGVDG